MSTAIASSRPHWRQNLGHALIATVLTAIVVTPIFGLHLERKGARSYIEPHWNLVIWGFVIVLVLQLIKPMLAKQMAKVLAQAHANGTNPSKVRDWIDGVEPRDGEPVGLRQRLRRRHPAVTVGVGLDHCHDASRGRGGADAIEVVTQRGGVDDRADQWLHAECLRPLSRRIRSRPWRGSRSACTCRGR